MLNTKRLLNDHYTQLCDVTLWITKHYGPSIRPSVPKILSRESELSRWSEDDPRPVFDWAEGTFERLLEHMQLTDWPVQLVADGQKADTHPKQLIDSLRSRSWDAGRFPGYLVDGYGRPIIYYDPRKCAMPSYFLNEVLSKLVMIKLFVNARPKAFDKYDAETIQNIMFCHHGFGFEMLAYFESSRDTNLSAFKFKKPTEYGFRTLEMMYGSVICLAAHRYSPEQIISTYGPILSKSTRRAIWPICKVIEKDTDFMKLVRLMTDNRKSAPLAPTDKRLKHTELVEHTLQRQAQS